MTRSFRDISPDISRRIRLIMTDVDGTLTVDGETFLPEVAGIVRRLKEAGIGVGLVSGRTLPRLKKVAVLLDASGPLIAENGGVAQLKVNDDVLDLGYSRQPALEAVEKLKAAFPGMIRERKDNEFRTVDVTIHSGVPVRELLTIVPDIQISDSGYMVHVMAAGISKGGTLRRILSSCEDGSLTPDDVMVFGDSPTDISLFQFFPNSVLIINPRLSPEQERMMAGAAAYRSELPVEQGFVQVAEHVIATRGEVTRPAKESYKR